jgi:hypothetical protein
MADERSGARRSRFLSFFTTLPGLLTAIAALLSAVTGLIVVIAKLEQGGGDGTASGTAGLPTSVGPSALIYHSGNLTVHAGDYVDLDKGLVGNGGNLDTDWHVADPPDPDWRLTTIWSGGMAPLGGSTTASRDACQTALGSRRDGAYVATPSSVNHWICVSTSDQRTAAFRFDRVSSSPAELAVTFVVWRSPQA